MSIQYIPYKNINKQKWDNCIANADNELIYGYSFYLDAMCKHWDALVLNDYEAVMPLTWNKKYGIYYLYQPFFCASLGVFGKNIDAPLVNNFLLTIPSQFKYWDFYLNYGNHFALPDFNLYERRNFILPLNDSYETLSKNFKDNVIRNIKKAEKLNCVVKTNIDIDEVIALSKEQSKAFSPITDKDFERFKTIYNFLQPSGKATTYGVFTSNNQLVASCVFVFSKNRAYYILVGNHPNGKTIGASHLLISRFIQDYANSNYVLDFEGSDINSLAFFYSSFGAIEEKFAGIKVNKLPFWAKWLKK